MSVLSRDICESVQQFVIRESSLLDDSKLAEWQQLFAADGTYWMPLDPTQPDAVNHVSLIYDDRTLMDLRCRRLRDADDVSSLSLHPYPQSLRFLSNLHVSVDAPGQLAVRANLMAVQHAAGITQQFFARVRWTLTGTAPDFLIRQKRVDLLTAGAPLRDILVYL